MSSMSPRDPIELEGLVAQVQWVRNLALAVARSARDAGGADDLAQEAWLAALRRGPAASRPATAWFSRVMGNLVRFQARSDARRRDRERQVARPERDEASAHAMERIEMQEELLRAVRELDEPYRTTVILRWFEGLEPAEIARRSNVPVRTVHTRVTRALRILRERLDRRSDGGRSAWMSAWIPLLTKPAGPWPWIIAMDVKLKIAIAGAVVAGALTVLYFALPGGEASFVSSAARRAAAAPPLEASTPANEPTRSREIVEGSERDPEPAALAVAGPADPSIHEIDAIVLDPVGRPLADLDVEFRTSGSGAPERARSAADGTLHFATRSSKGVLVPVSAEWTTVLEPKVNWANRHDARYVLVVAPLIALEGRVVDDRKRPIAGAEVRCSPPPIRERLELVLDDCAWVQWKSTTDSEGRFRLPVVPAMAGAELVTEAAGFERDVREMPLASRTDLEIQLTWPPSLASHVRGRVVDFQGGGIGGAYVALGKRSTRTDAAGRFDLDLERPLAFSVGASPSMGKASNQPRPVEPEARTLRALKQGFLPKEVDCATPSPRDIGAWPDPVVIVLESESLSISGRVVDDLGAPVAQAEVWVLDLTPFGEVEFEFGEKHFPQNATVETLLSTRSDGQMAWLSTRTDASGLFEHDGLLPKRYRLRVFDRKSMAMRITEPYLAPRKDLEIVLANRDRYARIAGFVVDRDEKPIAHAKVQASISFAGSIDRIGLYGAEVSTDDGGGFELRDLSREVDELFVTVDGSPNETVVRLAREPNVEGIRVRLARPCHLQVDLSGSRIRADSFAVFDEKGKMLALSMIQGDTAVCGNQFFELVDGHSQAMSTSDDARKLELRLEGRIVGEIPLHLAPGELNIVRP